jgi:serine protease SohB
MSWRKILRVIPLRRFREPPPRVAVLRLAGVIGSLGPLRQGLTGHGLERSIARAFELPDLAAVALSVNSPGGSPAQAALIGKRIRDLAAEKDVKLLAFCEDVAASGGYWLAAAADEIFVQESSIVGSIGVISSGFGFGGLIDRFGIERRVHTAGEKKSMLDPFKPENPDDIARLKAIQEEIHGHFKDWVTERRGPKLTADSQTLFSGEFWTGGKAIELGLADARGELLADGAFRLGERDKPQPRRSLFVALDLGRRSLGRPGRARPLEPLRALMWYPA